MLSGSDAVFAANTADSLETVFRVRSQPLLAWTEDTDPKGEPGFLHMPSTLSKWVISVEQ